MRTARHEVLERVFNAIWREGFGESRRFARGLATVRLPGGAEVSAPAARMSSLGTLRTTLPYYLRLPGGSLETLSEPEELIELLPEGDGMLERWKGEVSQSAGNMEFFLKMAATRRGEWAGAATLREAAPRAAGQFGLRPEEYLESWVLRGHPLHPGCKTRWGFSQNDLQRYSPELGRPVALRFFALRRGLVGEHVSRPGAPAPFPEAWTRAFDSELSASALAPSDYAVLAAHPWQADNILPKVFRKEFRSGALLSLETSFAAQPLTSVRTMAPLCASALMHLKLPLAIQSTSAERTVSAPSVRNGPALSRWISAALENAASPRETLELCEETRGLHFRDPEASDADPAALEKARHLSMLARARPKAVAGTTLMPAALLAERSPIDRRPVAAELAEWRGDAEEFFAECAETTARAVLPLLLRGLALEAHGQNVLLRLDGRGRPVSTVLRDLGGVRYLKNWMEETAPFEPHPATLIAAADTDELVGKLHHSWIQGLLAPIADALSEGCGVPEISLWAAARPRIRAVWRACAHGSRAAALEKTFFKASMRVKALTRMRLNKRYASYDWCEIDNPLSGKA